MPCFGFLNTLEDVAYVGFRLMAEAHPEQDIDGE
jgi:hypothetical protein